MKIKTVCEATGLTDRAIRYYIKEGLISPDYTENYLGRKNFDFSDLDVSVLNDIAVLRKFGFSVSEIKEMIINPERIMQIVMELQNRKQVIINEEQTLLSVLSRLDTEPVYSVSELASVLSAPVAENPVPTDDGKWHINKLWEGLAKPMLILLITWLPVIFSLMIIINSLRIYHYPKVSLRCIILTIISLQPTLFNLLLPKIRIKPRIRNIAKRILWLLCFLSIPISSIVSIGIIQYSETTDIRNYRDFDPDCLANRSGFFHELFPGWPHYFVNEEQPDGSWEAIYLDAHYYYRFLMVFDYTYDIYAEWPLEKEDFDDEVSRFKHCLKKMLLLRMKRMNGIIT